MPAPRVNVYLITGGRFHDTDFARLELLKLLADQPNIRTKVGNDYSDIANITAADLIITYTCDIQANPEQTRVLRDYIARGGRWFALHGTNSILRMTDEGTCNCPRDQAQDYFELLGSQFLAHPPIEPYRVDIIDPDHMMTRGIEPFDTLDEQYLSRVVADIHILMDTKFQGEAPGFLGNEHWPEETTHPVLYSRKLGEGEIMYLTLGHCRSHYDLEPILPYWPVVDRCSWSMPVYYELLRRGIRWGVGDAVAYG